MPVETVYALSKTNITVSGGGDLSGINQGTGVHLLGRTITLNNNNWQAMSVNDNDPAFQDNDGSQTLAGAQTVNGTTYASGRTVEAEYGLTLQDPDGNIYRVVGFNINEPGVTAFATVEALAFVGGVGGFPPIGVPLTVIANQEGPSVPYADLASPPCFTKGCMLDTPDGERAVETLRIGDLVNTLDHGPQPIRWIGSHRLPRAVLTDHPKFKPILLRKDALGTGMPSRDIHLSPQHRIVVTGWQAELLFGDHEILVPACKLVNDHSIMIDHNTDGICYFHLMFDSHEIVMADGLATESYLPGICDDDAAEVQQEIEALFPNLSSTIKSLTARICISDKRAFALGAMIAP